ncbi:MAG TPA: J domain-containing protein [Vicinamibacteria bacterium]|nr:J domain-containing protein [Vicinamibacteria bacterium]
MNDPLLRAYAVLELTPGASLQQVRKQYRSLAKRWHPDRYSGDPVGQRDAAVRMQQLNIAYRALVAVLSAAEAEAEGLPAGMAESGSHPEVNEAERPFAASAPMRPGARLSREQIEEIVEAIRGESSWRIDWTNRWNWISAGIAIGSTPLYWSAGLLWMPILLLLMIWLGDEFVRAFGSLMLIYFNALMLVALLIIYVMM